MYYRLKKDFQHINSNQKIETIKEGTEIKDKQGDYYIAFQNKQKIEIPAEIVENNPEYFEKYDLQSQLESVIRKNKKDNKINRKFAENVVDFLYNEYFLDKEIVSEDLIETMLEACRQMYMNTEDESWLYPIQQLGYTVDEYGIQKNE